MAKLKRLQKDETKLEIPKPVYIRRKSRDCTDVFIDTGLLCHLWCEMTHRKCEYENNQKGTAPFRHEPITVQAIGGRTIRFMLPDEYSELPQPA
jgi:hypothetical protein